MIPGFAGEFGSSTCLTAAYKRGEGGLSGNRLAVEIKCSINREGVSQFNS